MSQTQLEKQTSKNVQDKASVIWETATHLYGTYKPHEYGKVILPMTVIKRFDDALIDTKDKVIEQYNKFRKMGSNNTGLESAVYQKLTGYKFYNTSKFTLAKLTEDPDNIRANFEAYLRGYSENVIDIINNFNFFDEIKKMDDAGLLNTVITEFCSKKASMKPDEITSADMGYIFEELIRKFSESYDEQAGAHFTARDIIYLMTELLVINDKEKFKEHGIAVTAYDMAMGTSQMLGCLTEKLQEIDPNAKVTCYGQEINNETYAIAKSDMLIKGGDAENMKWGDTLSQDAFNGYEFDYIISNPPFGIDWKKEKDAVIKEHNIGELGRFEAGLPAVGDGQMLFLQNGIKKLKDSGKMAIIQNGASLFNGDAGSGPSDIRKYIFENDLYDAVIQLPSDLFYNTPITTYILLISKKKEEKRRNKIQLIDASQCFLKRRKNIGDKKVELDEECIKLILKAYSNFEHDKEYSGTNSSGNSIKVVSRVYENDEFKYTRVIIESPMLDEKGEPIIKKGKMIADNGKRDTENIPDSTSFTDFLNINIFPYDKYAWIDVSKNKIGFEIPFTRLFYKFEQPEKSSTIMNNIKTLEDKENALFESLSLSLKKSLFCETDVLVDSNVPWIGKIPSTWKLTPFKRLCKYKKEIAGENSSKYDRLALTLNGVIKRDKNDSDGLQPEEFDSYQIVKQGDFIFKMIDLQNISTSRVGVSSFEGIVSPAYLRFEPQVRDTRYIYYFLMNLYFNCVFNNLGGDGVRSSLNQKDMGDLIIPMPPANEQEHIIDILEERSNICNEIMELKKQTTELYKSYKQSLLYEGTCFKNN